MKIYKIILYFLTATVILASCIKDKSVGEINSISKIAATGKLDSIYSLDRLDTLRINAPDITQTNTAKPVSYSWEMNYKEISKEKNLNYVCTQTGMFTCRLKISNEDGAYYKTFLVEVRPPYSRGLYILGSLNNKTIVSYYADSIPSKPFTLDVYEKNNPTVSLGTDPQYLFVTNSTLHNQVYIATGNPSALYRLDGNTMIGQSKFNTDGNVTYIDNNSANTTVLDIQFVMNKRIAMLNYKDTLITNSKQQSFETTFGAVSFFDKFYYWKTPDLQYTSGEMYFDELNSRMVCSSSYGSPRRRQLFTGKFTGLLPVGFCYANNKVELAGVFKSKTDPTSIKVFWFNPGYGSTVKPEIKYEGVPPVTSELTANSIITSSPSKNIMYYSSGSKIFAYSILSAGNFPTNPLFTADASDETIAAMMISKDDGKLYVGTNASTGTLKGSIYCYNINNNTLLWKKKNITGVIKQLDYRYN